MNIVAFAQFENGEEIMLNDSSHDCGQQKCSQCTRLIKEKFVIVFHQIPQVYWSSSLLV